VHLDRVGSEEEPHSELRDFAADELSRKSGREPEGDDEGSPAAAPPREGLPKRFRMRHGRHYVDELLGDAPLRTVREIPISEIDPPPDEAIDLEALEASIKKLGVIEPLLVGRRGVQYRVIAGMRRLRAARTVGLNTVPCLVHEIDDDKLADLREATMHRITVSVLPPALPAPEAIAVALDDEPLQDLSSADEPEPISDRDASPRIAADDRLRSSVLQDLEHVEQLRAKIVSASADVLARTAPPIERARISTAELLRDAVGAVALEARLRGVRIETIDIVGQQADYAMSIDGARCRTAITGLLQCLLMLAPGPGAIVDVRAQVTAVRPALIVECRVRGGGDTILDDDEVARFFDAGWDAHPFGSDGAMVLGALQRIARLHGGRVQVRSNAAVTFVVPRPLSDI
jgi:hypothetical protein